MESNAKPSLRIAGLHIEELKALRKVDWPADGMGWRGRVPDLLMIGGINGSGKTTLLEFLSDAVYALLRALTSSKLLETLRLQRFQRPTLEDPMETTASIVALLARDKHLLMGYDVEARFLQEATAAEAAIRSSLDEGHALVNGKWLIDVFAPRTLGPATTPPRCRSEWIAHVVSVGGLPEVRDLWQRIIGLPT